LNKFGRIALKTILWIVLAVIAVLLLAIFLIRLPAVQNFVVGKVTTYVEGKIHTPVRIGYINIEFPKKIVLEDVYFEDQTRDTLFAGEQLKVDISMFKLLKNTVEVQDLSLHGITAKISRTLPDSTFNFDYIIKAFASEKASTPTADTSAGLTFDIDKVVFERFHIVYTDEVIGLSSDVYLKQFASNVKTFDLTKNMAFNLPKVRIEGLNATIKQWGTAEAEDAPDAQDFGITDPSVAADKRLPDIGIQTADLKDIIIHYEDSSSAIKTKFVIQNLLANIEEIDLNKEYVKLKDLTLDGSDSEVYLGKIQKTVRVDTTASTPVNWVV